MSDNNEEDAVPMVAIIKGNNFETSEPLGVIYGENDEAFQKSLDSKLARIRAKFPDCTVYAKEA